MIPLEKLFYCCLNGAGKLDNPVFCHVCCCGKSAKMSHCSTIASSDNWQLAAVALKAHSSNSRSAPSETLHKQVCYDLSPKSCLYLSQLLCYIILCIGQCSSPQMGLTWINSVAVIQLSIF